MTDLDLILGGHAVTVTVATTIVAGWTGRDRVAVEHHIAELAELGVPRPSRSPLFYRISGSRLTTAAEIESTPASSGEVEPVLLQHDGRLWIGTGSDHTDRELESHDVAMSKQLCDKPLASEFWLYEEVADHWDELTLRSWITESISSEVTYQDGTLAAMLPADTLLRSAEPALTDGTVMFCGTIPAEGGIRPAAQFRFELADPVLGRVIAGSYAMRVLPMIR